MQERFGVSSFLWGTDGFVEGDCVCPRFRVVSDASPFLVVVEGASDAGRSWWGWVAVLSVPLDAVGSSDAGVDEWVFVLNPREEWVFHPLRFVP